MAIQLSNNIDSRTTEFIQSVQDSPASFPSSVRLLITFTENCTQVPVLSNPRIKIWIMQTPLKSFIILDTSHTDIDILVSDLEQIAACDKIKLVSGLYKLITINQIS